MRREPGGALAAGVSSSPDRNLLQDACVAFETWLMFCAVALAAGLSPGPAILLAISNGVARGALAVVCSSLGNVAGLLVISSVSMFGLGALLKTSATAFLVAKLVGAAYLIWLGIKQWRRRVVATETPADTVARARVGRLALMREGLFVALTNPKAIAFFTALFPVFLDAQRAILPQFALMTASMMLISFLCLMVYGLAARRARRWLALPGRQRMFQRLTGTVFIALGGSMLTLSRAT
jgi:threonine/homoserine/homoserine lactone efflux protein